MQPNSLPFKRSLKLATARVCAALRARPCLSHCDFLLLDLDPRHPRRVSELWCCVVLKGDQKQTSHFWGVRIHKERHSQLDPVSYGDAGEQKGEEKITKAALFPAGRRGPTRPTRPLPPGAGSPGARRSAPPRPRTAAAPPPAGSPVREEKGLKRVAACTQRQKSVLELHSRSRLFPCHFLSTANCSN